MSSTAPVEDVTAPVALGWLNSVELAVLGAIWGASFLFQRIAAPEFGALPLVEMRLLLGAIALSPIFWLARKQFSWSQLPLLLGVGVINSALPFALFAWGAERAPAGIGAITNSLTVLFTALVAFVIYGERIGIRRALALLVGFFGVVILAAGKTAGASVTEAAIAGSLAALSYGFGVNLVRRKLTGFSPVALGTATLGPAAVAMLPFALWQWPEQNPSVAAWVSAVVLGLVCTGAAYAFYFRLIGRMGAPRAATVTYLIPFFGVGWSWLFLGEVPTLSMFLAGALILGSVVVSQRSTS